MSNFLKLQPDVVLPDEFDSITNRIKLFSHAQYGSTALPGGCAVQLQAAIAELAALGSGTICLDPGTFKIEAAILLHPKVNILGSGMFNTTIAPASGYNGALMYRPEPTDAEINTTAQFAYTFSAVISELCLFGNGVTTYGLDLGMVSYANFPHLFIRNCATALRMTGGINVRFGVLEIWNGGDGLVLDRTATTYTAFGGQRQPTNIVLFERLNVTSITGRALYFGHGGGLKIAHMGTEVCGSAGTDGIVWLDEPVWSNYHSCNIESWASELCEGTSLLRITGNATQKVRVSLRNCNAIPEGTEKTTNAIKLSTAAAEILLSLHQCDFQGHTGTGIAASGTTATVRSTDSKTLTQSGGFTYTDGGGNY